MPRWFWRLLAPSAVIAAAVLAVVRPGGPSDQKSFAHVITATPGVEVLHLELDMNVTNGSGRPCDPVDASAEHRYDDTYQVAVCVTGLTEGDPVWGFELDVTYDDTLNLAPDATPQSPYGRDDNPDANAGTNKWGDGLGEYWDCSVDETDYPTGHKDPPTVPGKGDAFIDCYRGETLKLGDNERAGVLALIMFQAQGVAGTDTLTIAQGYLDFAKGGGTCGEEEEGYDHIPCFVGTDIKVAPPHKRKTLTPTPAATATATVTPTQLPPTAAFSPTPTPTPTMFGGPGGRVVKPPPTGSGPSGGGSPQTVWLFALAGAAGAAAAVDGFRRFARRSRT